jgi:hypothetical protein
MVSTGTGAGDVPMDEASARFAEDRSPGGHGSLGTHPGCLDPWVTNSKRNVAVRNSIVHGISLVLRPINLP